MNGLQVAGELFDVLWIEKLAYNVTRLEPPDSLHILLDRTPIIALRVQMVTVLPKNVHQPVCVVLLRLGDTYWHIVQVLFEQQRELGLQILLVQVMDVVLAVEQIEGAPFVQNRLDLSCAAKNANILIGASNWLLGILPQI